MSFTRFFPQAAQAFALPAQNPAALARVALPCLGLGVAAVVVRDSGIAGAAGLGTALYAFAFGGLGLFWQRLAVGGDAAPLSPPHLVLRLLLWTLAYQLLSGFEMFPALMLNMMFEGNANAEMLSRTGQQLFQILIGTFFLLLPHLAAASWKDLIGTRLQEMVLAGGLAVGLGYVLVTMPFLVMGELAKGGFGVITGATGQGVFELVIHFASALIAAGYFAQVWTILRETAPNLTAAAQGQPETPDEPARARRTTRITKTTKAKR